MASVSARFDNGTNDQAFHPLSGKRGERQDLTLPSRSALHERPKPFAVHLGSASRSRSFAALHPDPRLEPKLRGGSPAAPRFKPKPVPVRLLDPCFRPEPRAVHRSDHCRGRSPGNSPGGLRRPKPLQVPRRVPASGRSLGGSPFPKFRASRSWSVLPAETSCRPKPVVRSGSDPRQSRSSGGSPSEAPCRPKPIGFSGFGSPQSRSPSGSPLAVP